MPRLLSRRPELLLLPILQVVLRVLVKHSPPGALPDANDAMVEDRPAARASTVGDQQRNLDRPHRATDVALSIRRFEPVPPRLWPFRLAQTDVQPGSILTGGFQGGDDLIRGAFVVARAVHGLVGLHPPQGTMTLPAIRDPACNHGHLPATFEQV